MKHRVLEAQHLPRRRAVRTGVSVSARHRQISWLCAKTNSPAANADTSATFPPPTASTPSGKLALNPRSHHRCGWSLLSFVAGAKNSVTLVKARDHAAGDRHEFDAFQHADRQQRVQARATSISSTHSAQRHARSGIAWRKAVHHVRTDDQFVDYWRSHGTFRGRLFGRRSRRRKTLAGFFRRNLASGFVACASLP